MANVATKTSAVSAVLGTICLTACGTGPTERADTSSQDTWWDNDWVCARETTREILPGAFADSTTQPPTDIETAIRAAARDEGYAEPGAPQWENQVVDSFVKDVADDLAARGDQGGDTLQVATGYAAATLREVDGSWLVTMIRLPAACGPFDLAEGTAGFEQIRDLVVSADGRNITIPADIQGTPALITVDVRADDTAGWRRAGWLVAQEGDTTMTFVPATPETATPIEPPKPGRPFHDSETLDMPTDIAGADNDVLLCVPPGAQPRYSCSPAAG